MTTFYIQQFGCRATQADGAALERQLLDRGCTTASDSVSASIVVLNTCTVTAAADAQARDAIRKIHAQNPHARLIVTGCYAQRAPEELASLPGVTWVVGNSHKPQIPNLVSSIGSVGARLAPPAVPATSNQFVSIASPIPDEPAAPDHAFVGAQFLAPSSPNLPRLPSPTNPYLPRPEPTPSVSLTPLNATFTKIDGGISETSPRSRTPSVGAQFLASNPGKISTPETPRHPAQILIGDIFAHPEFLSAPIQGGESHHTRPILKIQDGCNNRCSFCIIPYVRGKSRSLPPDAVIREIQALTSPNASASPAGQPILAVHQPAREIPVAQALLPVPVSSFTSSISSTSSASALLHPAREIVLSGINLGTYGRDLTPRAEFIDLIRRILDETSLERLRISSIEPQDVTQALIDLFATTDRIAQHFHLPLQSASDRILAAMHRWYRSEHYARRVDLIHDRLPHSALGADVIAGFPGETESDHAATLSFIERHPFTYLHVFSYSPRPGTKAASMPNQVPAQIIKRRARQLRALSEVKSTFFRRAQIGRTQRVLTLRRDEYSITEQAGAAYTPALSSNYLRVQVPGIHPSNQWLDVVIKSEEGNYLLAEPASICNEFSATSVLSASSV